MTNDDLEYVSKLARSGILKGAVLELGAGYGGGTCREVITEAGLEYFATDLVEGQGVDFVADFESADLAAKFGERRFGTVLVLNVLEHTFEPTRILDNAKSLLVQGGMLVTVTPAIWPLHRFPIDSVRLMPEWYERYSSSRHLELLYNDFEYLRFGRVTEIRGSDGTYEFPRPQSGRVHFWFSKLVHRFFNTYGRSMLFPSHLAIGAVMRCGGKG